MELRNSTAVVTGAGSGIGRAIARSLADAGCHVFCCGRRLGPLEETVALITDAGGSAAPAHVDITDYGLVEGAIRDALASRGAIDILVNNAGLFGCIGPLWDIDPQQWWRDVTVNLRGTMHCCRAVLPSMIERNTGLVVNMSGGGATWPLLAGSGYGCSKTAILRLTDTTAFELSRRGSKVIALALDPGFNDTGMTRNLAASEDIDTWMPHVHRMMEQKEGNTPEVVGRCLVELAQHACPQMAGRVFSVPFDARELARQGAELTAQDLLTLRLRSRP